MASTNRGPSYIAPPTGRPAGPPPAPVFATTGNARADSVLATLDATVAPFRSAPPPEQGAAGWVAQGLGGALGVVNAPMMFIDAAASQGVSALLDALGLAGLFPPMPVATIGLSMHLGTPHTHVHPPSLIPPAPPIPLPSLGVAFLAGSASVLVGGVPALRAGDIGIGLTCGSVAPPFEIMTGASGVYFAGARVARIGMDITFHCNPASAMGGFAIGMGVAGIVAGAAGAAAQASAGNAGAAAAQAVQAGLDAAAMAVSMLRGKDPAGPPGVGLLLGPPMGNVMAGGPPIPNVGALAQGKIFSALGRALRSMRGKLRRRTPPADANGRLCEGGEPVHVVSGHNYNTHRDFASLLGGFDWKRFTSSGHCSQRGVVGWGWRHVFECTLQFRLHQVIFEGYDGETIAFPRIRDAEPVSMHGYRLRRVTDSRYVVTHRRLGALEFVRDDPGRAVGRLVSVDHDDVRVELIYDAHRRLHEIVERDRAPRPKSATYTLHYGEVGQLSEIWGARFGEPAECLVRYHHDAGGDLVRADDAAGISEAFTYDRLHRITKATDRIGYSFAWAYDHEGRCTKTEGEDGLWAAAFEYRLGDQTTVMTIHDGTSYTYVYDQDGVITSVIGPCGSVKTRLRAPEGHVVAEVDDAGHRIDFVYDDAGGLAARRNRFGHSFPPSLDVPGVPRTLTRWLPRHAREFSFAQLPGQELTEPRIVERQRDRLGNVVFERDDRGQEQTWRFDAAGNQVAYVDRDGRVHRTAIVRWGLVGARIDPLGHATRYAHTPHQKISRVVDPGGSESSYVYDSHDRVIAVHRHGRVRERYRWDRAHRLIEKQDGAGQALLQLVPHANGLSGRVERADGGYCEYDYNDRGRATQADTADHSVRRSYDNDGSLMSDACDGHVVRHEVRPRGQVKTSVAQRFISWRHVSGNSVALVDPTGRERIVRTDVQGAVHIDHGNGTQEVQQYDAVGRLTARRCWHAKAGSLDAPRWAVRHQYTPAGDLCATADSVRGDRKYSLDAAHRLTGVHTADGPVARYQYDAAGNLTESPTVGALALHTGNRLQAAGIDRFDYDDRDRIALRRGVGDSTVRYHYDADDQLVRVDDGEDEPWTATYDGLGRRVTFGRGEAKTRLWWDGDRIAARHNPDASFRVYQYADRTSLVPLGFVDYDTIDAEPEDGRWYTLFCDQVGLPQHIEDDQGHVVWWCDHATPYGELFVRPGNTVECALRFAGHLYDADLGLHYNRFRDYDPRLGRYLQPDPLGVRGGVNLYAYPANPLVDVDILGLSHTKRDGEAGPTEDGDARPRTEDPNADDGTPPTDDPTAFPGLRRGGEPADTHAGRVADVVADLSTPDGRRRVAESRYDAETQRQADRARDRMTDPTRGEAAAAEVRQRRADNREAGVTREEGRLPRTKPGSTTVITHEDGSVSVGFSGGKNRNQSDAIVGEANRRHPPEPGADPTYRGNDRPVDNDGLVDAGRPHPTPGNCSEPDAGQAAGRHDSDPNGFQTVWAGDPARNNYSPEGHTLPGQPHQTMHPCATCQANAGSYL